MPEITAVINARPAEVGSAKYVRATKNMQASSIKTRAELAKFSARNNKLGASAAAAGKKLRGLFAGITGLLIIRKLVTTMSTFGETMATVRGVAGATEEQFLQLSETARRLGATTRFSATEAGEGLLFLARAGFETQEAIEALPSTLNLATAGAIGLGEAADIASNILSQFGLQASQTERIVDTLTTTSNSSNTNISQLAEAMKFAGPIAGVLGKSVEETAAAIGVLGDSGIQASLAGTGLRQIMLKLIAPTAKARKTIKDLGLSMDELDPQSKSIAEIFITLRKAGLGATEALNIFGIRTAGVATILAKGTDKLEELTQANIDAEGAAASMAKLMDDTLAGALRNLNSAFEEILLSTGDAGFKGALRGLVEIITGALRILAGMEKTVKKNKTAAQALAIALKTLTGVLIGLIAVKIVNFFLAMEAGALKATFAVGKLQRTLAALTVIVAAFQIGEAINKEFKIVGDTLAKGVALFALAGRRIVAAWNLAIGEIANFIVITLPKAMAYAGILLVAESEKAWENTILIAKASVGILADLAAGLAGFGTGSASQQLATDIELSNKRIDIAAKENARLLDKLFAGKAIDNLSEYTKELDKANDEFDKLIKAINTGSVAPPSGGDVTFTDPLAAAQLERGAKIAALFTDRIVEARKKFDELKTSAGERVELQFEVVGLGAAVTDFENTLQLFESGKLTIEEMSGAMKELGNQMNFIEESSTAFEKQIKKIIEAERLAAEMTRQVHATVADFGDAISNQFVNSFADVITGAKTAKQALGDFTSTLLDMIVQMLILQPIAASISGALVGTGPAAGSGGAVGGLLSGILLSEKGNVFQRGSLVPFSNGGIFSGPTAFPLSGGRTGLAGEAGPEAIMPLQRGPGGKLGIAAAGGGQTIVNVTINGVTDFDSFRQSKSQIAETVGMGINRARNQ